MVERVILRINYHVFLQATYDIRPNSWNPKAFFCVGVVFCPNKKEESKLKGRVILWNRKYPPEESSDPSPERRRQGFFPPAAVHFWRQDIPKKLRGCLVGLGP